MTKRVSASRYGLAKACTWAFRDESVWEQGSSYSSRFGSAFHEAADSAIRKPFDGGMSSHTAVDQLVHGVMSKHELTPGQVGKLVDSLASAAPVLDRLVAEGWASETAHYWHPITGAAGSTEDDGTHSYPKAPKGSYAGTVDVKLILDGGTKDETPVRVSHVVDWKTGYYIEHAKDSCQMRLLGLMLAKQFKLDTIATSIIRIRPNEAPAWLTHTLTAEELTAIEEEARRVHLSLAKPVATPGECCKRCPAKHTCEFTTVEKKK